MAALTARVEVLGLLAAAAMLLIVVKHAPPAAARDPDGRAGD